MEKSNNVATESSGTKSQVIDNVYSVRDLLYAENPTEVVINGNNVAVKEYEGVRVVTFKMIDELHQRPEGTASRNFRKNREHFVEGQDYFRISPDEFRRVIGEHMDKRQQNDITLVTQMGYLTLVKSFRDDLAWKVQRELVSTYFAKKEPMVTLQNMKNILYSPEWIIQIALALKSEQFRNEDLTKEIEAEKEKSEKLEAENTFIVDEINTIDDRNMIVAMVRSYASCCKYNKFGIGWAEFYKKLLYKYGINLKQRKSKNPQSKNNNLLDYLKVKEIPIAAKCAVGMCKEAGMDLERIVGKTSAKRLESLAE